MNVKNEFNQTLSAVEKVLQDAPADPRSIRESIKQLVSSYQAKEVVRSAYSSFNDSGVVQMKTFLRAANVQKNEAINDYVIRVRENLESMRSFDAKYLRP